MEKTLIILITLLLTVVLKAQSFEWVKSLGSSSDDRGYSITVDASGNVYTTGYFSETADFDPGAGTANLISAGAFDIFVQKLDANGNFVWAKSFGGSTQDRGNSITVDVSGNVYTTGYFEGTVDFDPGTGTANLTSLGGNEIFIQKLDASGNFIWAKSFGASSTDAGQSITVDASGNVYTTGNFQGTIDFDPGAGTAILISAGAFDFFVQKLDASGNFIWAKSFGGSSSDQVRSCTVDASGNIYTTGTFQGTADFDPGSGTANLSSAGGNDIFVQKLDASGNFIWVKSFGSSSNDYGYSITTDAFGNVYTTGTFCETVDFEMGAGTVNLTSEGETDVFVQKIDSFGNLIWAKSFGGNSSDFGLSITVDNSGNVYTTGGFHFSVDFDPGAGTANLNSVFIYPDIFIQKLDASGNFIWVKSFHGMSYDVGTSITVHISGNVYTTGYFLGTVNFGLGTGTTLTSIGGNDVFVHKISQGVIGIVDIGKGVRLKAFPNPSNGLVQLSFEEVLNNVEITLTNLQGKIVFTKKLDATTDEQLEIEGSAGVYFLTIKTPNEQSVVKLVKE